MIGAAWSISVGFALDIGIRIGRLVSHDLAEEERRLQRGPLQFGTPWYDDIGTSTAA